MSTSSVSTQGSLATYSGMKAVLSATQSTNIGGGDHIKWNSVVSQVGNDIWLDTTSPYTSGAGASIGRFTLAAGKTYRVEMRVPVQLSAQGALYYRLYNVTAGAWASSAGAYSISGVGENTVSDTGGLIDIVTPTTNTVYETRIFSATNLTNIFSAAGEPQLIIETVAAQIPYQTNASFRELAVTKSQVLKQNLTDPCSLQTYFFDINQITSWVTLLTITQTPTTSIWYRSTVTADICGHTGGVDNGLLKGAVWYFDCTNNVLTSGSLVAGTTSGGGAPQFRILVSGSQFLIQMQSSTGVNTWQGSAKIEVLLPRSGGSTATFTVS